MFHNLNDIARQRKSLRAVNTSFHPLCKKKEKEKRLTIFNNCEF